MTKRNRLLLRRIESYLRDTGAAETTFGLKAANDSHLLDRLRRGATVRPMTEHRILTFIAENPPKIRLRRING